MERLKRGFFKLYALVGTFLLSVQGIRIVAAVEQEKIQHAQRVRYSVYSEAGYIKPEDYPDQCFRDEYDECSVHFVALKGEQPIGSVRLVLDSPRLIPLENYFNVHLRHAPRERIAEASRLVVAKPYRGGQRLVMLALARAMYTHSRKRGITHWYAMISDKLAHSFSRFGIELVRVPEAPLADRHHAFRKPLKGYFDKNQPKPYVLSLDSL